MGGARGLQVVGDGIAPNSAQHPLHTLEEVFQREDTPRAFMFEVVQDPIPDIVNEGEVGAVARVRRPLQGNINPSRIVARYLMAANLKNR